MNYAKGNGPVPGSNFQYSGWTTEANHLGNVAYRTGKKIEWDYEAMRATNAPEAHLLIAERWAILERRNGTGRPPGAERRRPDDLPSPAMYSAGNRRPTPR